MLSLTEIRNLQPGTLIEGINYQKNVSGDIIGKDAWDTWKIVEVKSLEDTYTYLTQIWGEEEAQKSWKEFTQEEKLRTWIFIEAISVAGYDKAFKGHAESLSDICYDEIILAKI